MIKLHFLEHTVREKYDFSPDLLQRYSLPIHILLDIMYKFGSLLVSRIVSSIPCHVIVLSVIYFYMNEVTGCDK